MVPDLSGVVEDTTRRALDDFFQGLAFELGTRDQVVQVHHVGVVVLAVVVFQGLGGNVRLEGVLCVRQRRQFESHGFISLSSSGVCKRKVREAGSRGRPGSSVFTGLPQR
ncbi:hypothetical protein D3C86_1910530 [compost metagenome]